MIRVLQIVDSMGIGGIQVFIMNIYRNIDRKEIQFDFLIHRHSNESFEDEIQSLGGKIYIVPGRKEGIRKNKEGLKRFFSEHSEYACVHYHTNSLSYDEPLVAARNAGIPVRIIHSHSSNIGKNHKLIHMINHLLHKRRIEKIATNYLSCGELAGKWMFGGTNIEKQIRLINNGIDVSQYSYSRIVREEVRNELGLSEKFVIFHVGRFDPVKNQAFLVDIFNLLIKHEPKAVLVLVGAGRQFDEIREKVKVLDLEDKVRFLGIRNDVHRLLQAADRVVLPSLYEGFPVAAIEAQASGVPLIMSDTISPEVIKKSNCIRLSLNAPIKEWVDQILLEKERIEDNTELIKSGFDIATSVSQLVDLYKTEANNNCSSI